MSFDDFLDQGQADARAFVAVARRERLEHLEDALEVPRLDAGPVVAHREVPFAGQALAGDAHFAFGLVDVLDSVADQVLEDLLRTRTLDLQRGQPADFHADVGRRREQVDRFGHQFVQVDHGAWLADAADAAGSHAPVFTMR